MNQKTQADSSAPIGCSAVDGPQLPVNPARSADEVILDAIKALEELHAVELRMDTAGESAFSYRQGVCVGISRSLAALSRLKSKQAQPRTSDGS